MTTKTIIAKGAGRQASLRADDSAKGGYNNLDIITITPPPLSNRGGTEIERLLEEFQETEKYQKYMLDSKGRMIQEPILLRKGKSDSAFIDALTFTMHISTLDRTAGTVLFTNEDFIIEMSLQLEKIFGFGITEKASTKGNKFYEEMYLIKYNNILYGSVHIGGQKDTICIDITGTGCTVANSGWEKELFLFLESSTGGRITRIDVAKDFFKNEYTPDQAFDDWKNGLFTCHRVRPAVEKRGTDWESETLKGKTLYIGSRQSAKYVRVYDKAKQLKDTTSTWTRFEIQFKSCDAVIPISLLLAPAHYFAGAYPITSLLSETQQESRITVTIKKIERNLEHVIKHLKIQSGRALNAIFEFYPEYSASDILNMLKPSHNRLPINLIEENYVVGESEVPIHKEKRTIKVSDEFDYRFLEELGHLKIWATYPCPNRDT